MTMIISEERNNVEMRVRDKDKKKNNKKNRRQ